MFENYYKNKVVKYIILGVVFISLIILIKEVFFRPETLKVPEMLPSFPQVKIDFEFLERLEAEELSPFEKISFPEKIGRENPFIPY